MDNINICCRTRLGGTSKSCDRFEQLVWFLSMMTQPFFFVLAIITKRAWDGGRTMIGFRLTNGKMESSGPTQSLRSRLCFTSCLTCTYTIASLWKIIQQGDEGGDGHKERVTPWGMAADSEPRKLLCNPVHEVTDGEGGARGQSSWAGHYASEKWRLDL